MPDDRTKEDLFAQHERRAVQKLKAIVAVVGVVILAIFLIIVIG